MTVGETSKLYIRSDKGYGAGGFPAWGYPFIVNELRSTALPTPKLACFVLYLQILIIILKNDIFI